MSKLASIESIVVGDGRFRWQLVRLEDDEGTVGWGEGSDCPALPWEQAVHDVFAPRLVGEVVAPVPVRHRLATLGTHRLTGPADGLVLRTAASSIEQAAWDLHARTLGVPLAVALGGRIADRVRVYANLNRGLDRTGAHDLAAAGEAAVAAGFDAVKCAPFRGAEAGDPDCDLDSAVAAGLERVRALREAVGDAAVHVDAHGRFDRASAPKVATALATIGIGWLEDPVDHGDAAGFAAVKAAAPTIPLAAGELLAGWHAYRALLEGPVDVVLADVKHGGGHGALAEVAALGRAMGRRLSLHNPAGPVAALHSAHAAATQPSCFPLEHAFSVERAGQVERLLGEVEPIRNSLLSLPDGPGIGIDPDRGDLVSTGMRRRTER